MNNEEALLLAVISLGAFFVPFISKRLLLPSAVGEIIFGLLTGFFFKDIPHKMPTINFLSELGFIILMYLAGLEIDFQRMRATRTREVFLYVCFFGAIITSAFYIQALLKQPLIYALIYLTCAIGLLVPVLKDTGLIRTASGQVLLIIGSFGEILSLFAITVFVLYFSYGLSYNSLVHLLQMLAFFLISYSELRLFQLYIWWNPLKIETFLKTGGPAETGIRANFVNMFVFVSLASLFGIEPIIGAFFGGMLFALVFQQREEIIEKMSSFGYGFLVPLFFIELGLRFNLGDFFKQEIIVNAIILSALIFLIRIISSLVFVWSRLSFRTIALIPCSLSFPLTLMIAVATIGLETRIIGNTEAMVIILSAIVTALIYPWMFKVLARILSVD